MTIKLERYDIFPYVITGTKTVTKYAISKGQSGENIVMFEVSKTYPAAEQRQRAEEYRDYLNKIIDATEEAYSQTQLVDVLKR